MPAPALAARTKADAGRERRSAEEQLCAPDIDDGEVVETLRTPSAVALMADGLAWVVESDRYSVVKVDLEEKLRLRDHDERV